MNSQTILVTGGAGFLGYHTADLLLSQGHEVVIVDNQNNYYDICLKIHRIRDLKQRYGNKVTYRVLDIVDKASLERVFVEFEPQTVIHLAAQAGVRYSQENPMAYAHSNLMGTASVFDLCKKYRPQHLMYASSSSVYGNAPVPFREDQEGTPLSYYAVTKKSNELAAAVFHNETGIPTTGMRFFTAYGPAGRPDMAYWTFTEKILAGEPISIYGSGVARDFTYCQDVATAISKLMWVPQGNHVVNIGNNSPVSVSELVATLEHFLAKSAILVNVGLPSSDPQITCCDNSYLKQLTGYAPYTPFQTGIERFVQWYLDYKNKNK